MITKLLIGLVVALVVVWVALIVALAVFRPKDLSLKSSFRILSSTVRMLKGIARDPDVPRRSRMLLYGLLIYLALPIDLVPDFIPVIGYADDAILVAIVLRSVVHNAGDEAIRRHWNGSRDDLTVLMRLAGVSRGPADGPW